jgi:hypothetical protein
MLAVCSHICLLAADCAFIFDASMPRPSHHGENDHRLQEIPEGRGPAPAKLPELSKGAAEKPPNEVKRALHPDYAKRQAKKAKSKKTSANVTQ